MELLTRFSTSPEMTSQATANASQIFQQASESAMKLLESGAFANMMKGLLANYTEFLTELSHISRLMMSQCQTAMNRQAT